MPQLALTDDQTKQHALESMFWNAKAAVCKALSRRASRADGRQHVR